MDVVPVPDGGLEEGMVGIPGLEGEPEDGIDGIPDDEDEEGIDGTELWEDCCVEPQPSSRAARAPTGSNFVRAR
jgi:hypothetical protein